MSAQNIARKRRTTAQRTRLAVEWILGRLTIEPSTETLAARIFNVSTPTVHRALAETNLEPVSVVSQLNWLLSRLSIAERDEFVRANLLPLWDSIDRITR